MFINIFDVILLTNPSQLFDKKIFCGNKISIGTWQESVIPEQTVLIIKFYKRRIKVYRKENAMKRLPDSELKIMMIIWDLEAPVQREQIEEKLRETHPIALTTLLTLLSRLSEKGFVEIRRNGRRSEYIPLKDKREYQKEASRKFIDQIFGGSVSAFAAALNDNVISKEDLKELKRMLEDDEL